MKAIRLPAGTLYVRFDELPHLLAGALHPESSQDDDNLDAALAEIGYEGGDLRRAVESGALVVKNPLTMLPLSFTLGQALNRGVVTVDDLQTFTAGLGLSVAVGGDRAKPWEKLFPLYEPREGLYMLAQAAQEIADSDGWGDESWEALEQRMLEAVRDGKLPRRCRRTGMEVLPDSNEFLVLVTIDDVNAWLATERVAYRWKRHPARAQSAAEPAPVVPDSASDAPVVTESTEQRRARWLDWYGKGERGALQRVFERELLRNPKADRSYIGKQIKKAEKEKQQSRPSGNMVSQLVQSGKRQR